MKSCFHDYFKPQKFFVKYLYFYAKGRKYVGKGIITWNPSEGFNLNALLEGPQAYQERTELGRVHIPEKSDYCSIRMWISDIGWALIPEVNISRLELSLLEGKPSIKFNQFFICEACIPSHSDLSWQGNSLYRIEACQRFPDSVEVETRIAGELILLVGSSGFSYEKGNTKIIGYFVDKKYFHLSWKLSKQSYKKQEAWDWSVGFQEALQIWLGETVQLLKREMRRDAQKITEVRKEVEHQTLGLFSFFGQEEVPKDLIVNMADFFGKKKEGKKKEDREVCRNIFWQILEARKGYQRKAGRIHTDRSVYQSQTLPFDRLRANGFSAFGLSLSKPISDATCPGLS